MDDYVEEWGESYSGRILSWQEGNTEENNYVHIWDYIPENPKQLEELDENSCKWPIGHPDEKSFYFCGRSSLKDFSYCKLHLLYAYQPKGKKENSITTKEKEEIPDFLRNKTRSG